MNSEQELYDMLAELRRRQLVALKADNAVLEQHLAIWHQYQVNEARKAEPAIVVESYSDGRIPNSMVEAVDRAVNGDSLSIDQIVLAVEARFPKMSVHPKAAYRALWTLVKREKFTKTKSGKKFIYTRAMWLLLLIPFLFGCRTPEYSKIMPRRMPDAPRPIETVRAAPTTRTYSLSWTHDPMPWLLTYRVDYGIYYDGELETLTNSLMTQATDCTIRGLDSGREYVFRVVGCDGKRYSELENLHIVIK